MNKRKRLQGAVIAAVWMFCLHVGALNASEQWWFETYTPGEPFYLRDNVALMPDEEMLNKDPWFAVRLDGQNLVVERVVKTRPSDWLKASSQLDESKGVASAPVYQPEGVALALPGNALFAFNAGGNRFFEPGSYPSVIPSGAVLQEDWQLRATLSGKTWTLYTSHQERPDGKLLAGSLALYAAQADQVPVLLVPPASGMAFLKQEILWLGDMDHDARPDVLLKRSWPTGEIDYVIAVDSQTGSAYLDPDYPDRIFSSGVENSLEKSRHIHQTVAEPDGRFGVAAFAISEDAWNGAVGEGETQLPKLIADRQLQLAGEPLRFTIEYLPRVRVEDGASSDSRAFFWGGSYLVQVQFRQVKQTLMQVGALDGGPFRVQIDTLQGQPAIQIEYSPHYNNGFTRYWIWSPAETKGRFKRLSSYQSQGC